jgi:hypothetical protein
VKDTGKGWAGLEKTTTPGIHGNTSSGIRKTELALRKGEPFDGFALECYERARDAVGYSEAQLAELGARGEFIRATCRLSALAEVIWAGVLGTASVGHVADFFKLANNYGSRLDSARKAWRELIEFERVAKEAEASVLDLSDAHQAAQEAMGNE